MVNIYLKHVLIRIILILSEYRNTLKRLTLRQKSSGLYKYRLISFLRYSRVFQWMVIVRLEIWDSSSFRLNVSLPYLCWFQDYLRPVSINQNCFYYKPSDHICITWADLHLFSCLMFSLNHLSFFRTNTIKQIHDESFSFCCS